MIPVSTLPPYIALAVARASAAARALVSSPAWRWTAEHAREIGYDMQWPLMRRLAQAVHAHPELHGAALEECRKLYTGLADGGYDCETVWQLALVAARTAAPMPPWPDISRARLPWRVRAPEHQAASLERFPPRVRAAVREALAQSCTA